MANSKKTTKPEETTEAKETEMVTVQCVCSNVHLGNGVVLKAEQNSKGNWKNGTTAEVPLTVAKMLVKNEQCEIL